MVSLLIYVCLSPSHLRISLILISHVFPSHLCKSFLLIYVCLSSSHLRLSNLIFACFSFSFMLVFPLLHACRSSHLSIPPLLFSYAFPLIYACPPHLHMPFSFTSASLDDIAITFFSWRSERRNIKHSPTLSHSYNHKYSNTD